MSINAKVYPGVTFQSTKQCDFPDLYAIFDRFRSGGADRIVADSHRHEILAYIRSFRRISRYFVQKTTYIYLCTFMAVTENTDAIRIVISKNPEMSHKVLPVSLSFGYTTETAVNGTLKTDTRKSELARQRMKMFPRFRSFLDL